MKRSVLLAAIAACALVAGGTGFAHRRAAAAEPVTGLEWREVRHSLTSSYVQYVAGDNPVLHSALGRDLNSRLFVARQPQGWLVFHVITGIHPDTRIRHASTTFVSDPGHLMAWEFIQNAETRVVFPRGEE